MRTPEFASRELSAPVLFDSTALERRSPLRSLPHDWMFAAPGTGARALRALPRLQAAFTLLEMIVVIAIIGLLASLTVPSFKMLGHGDVMMVASRQLIDDLALARIRAINGRTTVYVVFFPEQSKLGIIDDPVVAGYFFTNITANRLLGGQLTSYAIYAERSVGDQPGRVTPRYLTEWRTLPKGVYFWPEVFGSTNVAGGIYPLDGNTNVFFNAVGHTNASSRMFELPDVRGTNWFKYSLPYLAFDAQGRLAGPVAPVADVKLPLALGSVSVSKDASGQTNFVVDPSAKEKPLTSAARLLPGTPVINSGATYLVVGSWPISYNGTIYKPGGIFVGVPTVTGFTAVPGGPPVEVREFEGVSINWLTGRARTLRQEL
jgi:prepilin-type N-terminal cleavage/methylation domain-containing protein